jgi:4-amino-4-deoxy-L-arabinose transferase-like glycosyltransferase
MKNHATVLLLLCLLAGVLFFVRLGAPGLFDADEPAYAQAAREMMERGDWVTPTFNGNPRFDKPVLFYWLIIASYRIFGVTEFAVRCWSALSAVGLTLMLCLAARRWFGPPADLWAGLAFATSALTALLARAAVTDMLLTLFVTAAVLSFLAALESSTQPLPLLSPTSGGEAGVMGKAGRAWARAGWGAMALAVLVKGPVGLVIPALALGPALLILREFRSGLRRLIPWEGPVLFLALAAPWYVLVWNANGWAFVEGFILKHHVTRYTGVVSSHAGPLWYYLPVILVGFFPWSGFLPAALWAAWRTARARRAERPADRALVICACWLLGLFLFFSAAGTKLPSYLFPAFPAMALLVGACGIENEKCSIDEARIQSRLARLAPWIIGLVGALLAIGFALIPFLFDRLRPAARGVLDGVPAPTVLAFALAALVGIGTAAGLLARGPARPAVLAAMMACLILAAGSFVAPGAHRILQAPLRDFSERARQVLGPGDPLVVYGLNAPSIVFYAGRTVIPMGAGSPGALESLQGLANTGRPVVIITRAALASQLDRVPGLSRWAARGGYAVYGAPETARSRLSP